MTAILLCQVIFSPLHDVVWLEPPAFQEELVKSPTFLNFADPILHNIVIKDTFTWVYLVSTERITNRVSLEIIGIGYNSLEMDRDRYSGNCLFNIEADHGEEGHRTQLPRRYPERCFALIGMYAWRSLKTNEKESYMTQKIEVSDVEIPDSPQSKKIRYTSSWGHRKCMTP